MTDINHDPYKTLEPPKWSAEDIASIVGISLEALTYVEGYERVNDHRIIIKMTNGQKFTISVNHDKSHNWDEHDGVFS